MLFLFLENQGWINNTHAHSFKVDIFTMTKTTETAWKKYLERKMWIIIANYVKSFTYWGNISLMVKINKLVKIDQR